ncbi:hypothetical protein C8R43DRAFT_1125395 [Mycena crocata]|nr:hypothetical protein C8R43DRAFT_1125395 [Mycena crocata]
MALKRKQRRDHIDIPTEVQGAQSIGGAATDILAAAGQRIVREAATVGVDGSVKVAHKVTGSQLPPESIPAPLLHPEDFRPPSPPPRIYDLHEQEDTTPAYLAPDPDAPRDMRDSDYPLREWVEENREEFLRELLRAEGRGDHREYAVCPGCATENAEYRCKSCLMGGEMLCKACVVQRHQGNPLHPIELWTGVHFEKKTLKQLGLRIQLGHWHRDRRCPVPERAPGDDFVIVDDHGVHEVALDFCGCGGGSQSQQLLRAGLMPATSQFPRTASTFSVLRRFGLLTFESKCSAYEFYHSLARETDNTGLNPAKDRYHEFLRMTRIWEHLQMLKRAGRCHNPSGAAGTRAGECALLCPACPQPGKNLPPEWKDVPEDKRFLYALFLAIDANFRLKRKDVSSEEADPGLGPGWAFFSEVKAYMAHLAEHWDEPQERSTCVAHDAVDKPDRESRGTASSGVGTIDCARHNMKRPNGVGDLQLGERYINMDYMFFRSIAGTEIDRFFVSYDIACQWHKNIWVRMSKYAPELWFEGDRKYMTFLVPKFHLPAHIEECNLRFSFNLTRDVGRTDGEAPERGWAKTNPLASSTKEKGPGARRDALDAHFNDQNHKIGIAFGRVMLQKVTDGVPVMVEMKTAFADMEATLSAEALGVSESPVGAWTRMAELWEKDVQKPNPFEMLRKDDHLAKVRHDLAVEAASREAAGKEDTGAVRDGMHITEVLAMGLQLEEQQRTLHADVKATGAHPTKNQSRAMVERTSKLRRKIVSWIEIQRGFFPVVVTLRAREDAARARAAREQTRPGVQVYEMPLWLPSAIMKLPGAARRAVPPILKEAQLHEYRLRVGQSNEALDEIRRQLLVRTHLFKVKDAYSRGVRENTRSSDKIDVCNDRIRRMTAQYRAARAVLVVLGPVLKKDEWEKTLKPLLDSDVRGMPRATFGDPERQKATRHRNRRRVTKKRRTSKRTAPATVSWIWIVQAQQVKAGEPAAMNEALRIEWAKARARSLRWGEEIDLLEEEMRRIVQFLSWRSEWWEGRVDLRGLPDGPQREGETAYAMRQAKLQADTCTRFLELWKDLPVLIQTARAEASGSRGAAAGDTARASAAAASGGVEDTTALVVAGGDDDSDGEYGSEETESEDDEAAEPVPVVADRPINPLYLE